MQFVRKTPDSSDRLHIFDARPKRHCLNNRCFVQGESISRNPLLGTQALSGSPRPHDSPHFPLGQPLCRFGPVSYQIGELQG